MKKFLAILACVAAVSCFYAEETTEELLNPKNPMDRTVTEIVPEEQHIPTNLETGKKKPANVKIEYTENYDELRIFYTCMEVAFDKSDAMISVRSCLEDFTKQHGYYKYEYLKRDKVRHYKDERGIKWAEYASYVKLKR